MLLPSNGDPNSPASGFPLDVLYRNLAMVKGLVGGGPEVIVMINAGFTGETGRGDSLLAVSAQGFVPAAPRAGDGLVKLVATLGAAPANWDKELGFGLPTNRFLMGAGGLVDAEGLVEWDALGACLSDSVEAAAPRNSGRAHRDEALLPLASGGEDEAREADRAEWERRSALGD